MQRSEISFLLDIALSYITFGLAIYAIAGLIALMWIRRKMGTPQPLLRDMCLAYASIVGLIILDACRQLWDSFHTEQFPIQITRVLVPALYLVIGNALVSIAGFTHPEPLFVQTQEETAHQEQASA